MIGDYILSNRIGVERKTAEDRRELERNIKELEKQIDDLKAFGYDKTISEESERLNKELRRLRRRRNKRNNRN